MSQTQLAEAFPTSGRFEVEDYLRTVVRDQQDAIPEELTRLGLYLLPADSDDCLDLFKIVDGFGGNLVDEMPELFEITYAGVAGVLGVDGRSLRMTMTNPPEAVVAFERKWSGTGRVRDAVRSGSFRLIHGDAKDPLMDVIRGR